MPTIRFDWDKWTRSQWFGFPKNRMWGKVRGDGHNEAGEPNKQYTDEVVGSNPDSVSPGVADVARDHRFTGYRTDTYFDASGGVEDDEWVDHYGNEVAAELAVLPVITQAPLEDGTEGEEYSHTFQAVGTEPFTWSTAGSPPAGLTLDSETGEFSGTPTEAGDFTFNVGVTNIGGGDIWADVAITIAAAEEE